MMHTGGLRGTLVAVVTAALTITGCTGADPPDEAPVAELPATTPTPTPTPIPTATPTPAPEGPDEPDLDELRASDRYLALAEHQRAQQAPRGVRTGQNSWDVFAEAQWPNAAGLWDDIVQPIRDDALLAGEPATEPIWDEAQVDAQRPVVAFIDTYWNNESTQGRGYAYVFVTRFQDVDGRGVQRHHVVLVEPREDGSGSVYARSDPYDLRSADAPNWAAAREILADRAWEWVFSQEHVA